MPNKEFMHDMKFYLFVVIAVAISCSSNNTMNSTAQSQNQINNNSINDVVGSWYYEYTEPEDSIPLTTFIIEIVKINDSIVKGQYCNIARRGNRIDCPDMDEDTIWNMKGEYRKDTLYVSFKGFYDREARGKAKMFFKTKDSMVWYSPNEESNGNFFMPMEAVLWKEKNEKYPR